MRACMRACVRPCMALHALGRLRMRMQYSAAAPPHVHCMACIICVYPLCVRLCILAVATR